jgi:UDP-N-acetylmuramoyl-L-alanyl-D-glutamate--2,6-diaminopimelate ligase
VANAVQRGATACLVDAHGVEAWDFGCAPVAVMDNLQSHLGGLAAGFFGPSSAQLPVFAVTRHQRENIERLVAGAGPGRYGATRCSRAGFIGTLGCGLIRTRRGR